jgi:beta-lactamase class D
LDGVERSVDSWSRNQDLRSTVRNSAVWVFEKFAKEIGLKKETGYLEKIPYGNEITGGMEPFLVEGELAISAQEQIIFLKNLFHNNLPFSKEHQLLVKCQVPDDCARFLRITPALSSSRF